MYDTIYAILRKSDSGNADFLGETTNHFNVTGNGENEYGNYLYGNLDNLKISVSESKVKVSKGSLCKWYLGNNLYTMKRKDTEQAIQKLSDTLHLPFHNAIVTRLDLGKNFIMNNDKQEYLNHLGNSQYFHRLEQPDGLYYNNSSNSKNTTKQLVFYDKIKEHKACRGIVPDFLIGLNLFRYEMRLKKRLAREFNLPEIRAYMLYDSNFYIKVIDLWLSEYQKINKLNSIHFNYSMIKTKKQYTTQATLFYVMNQGGELQAIKEIQEAYKRGELSKKQAFDLRGMIKTACRNKQFTSNSDVIQELDNKIKYAVQYYR